jgi:hypothetical protein
MREGLITKPKAFIAKDMKCLEDLYKVIQKDGGLEARKQLAELLQYGCIETVPDSYAAIIVERKDLKAPDGKRISVAQAQLQRPYSVEGPASVNGYVFMPDLVAGKLPILETLPSRVLSSFPGRRPTPPCARSHYAAQD